VEGVFACSVRDVKKPHSEAWQGSETFPAAVICPVKYRPKWFAASTALVQHLLGQPKHEDKEERNEGKKERKER
jgi:hypothetical protein